MVAPIPELMATFRVLVVPWALPSNECDCEVLTVEAPFSVPVDRVCADRRPPLDPTGVLLTVNSDEATMTHTRFTVNSQHPEILGDLPAGGASDRTAAGRGRPVGQRPPADDAPPGGRVRRTGAERCSEGGRAGRRSCRQVREPAGPRSGIARVDGSGRAGSARGQALRGSTLLRLSRFCAASRM